MSLSVDAIELLLETAIAAISDGGAGLLFSHVARFGDEDWEANDAAPSAYVGLEEMADTGVRSRLVSEEVYAVIVVGKIGETDTARTIHALTAAVTLAIHGQHFNYDELEGFHKTGHVLLQASGRLVYKLSFTTRHAQFLTP